jgi:Zn-dependent protease with chaperone function
MERELDLMIMIFIMSGFATAVVGLIPVRRVSDVHRSERALWRAITRPFASFVVSVAMVSGWALHERGDAETPRAPLLLFAALVSLVWIRAIMRAVSSLRTKPAGPAMTVGLLHPLIVVSPSFAASIEPDVLAAVIAHEAAHARHHDPLRIFIAQLATDLQWPSTRARARFDHWMHVLELSRDDEARALGADGADLAAGVVAAARIKHVCGGVVARLTGTELMERIDRLLAPLTSTDALEPSRGRPIALIAAVGASLAFGAFYAEAIVRAL